MGTITIGNCQCQCYINYVSCDCSCDQNEIRTNRSNRFTEQSSRNRSKKRSPGDSSERQSKFSSTRKPTSRSKSSGSENTIYLLSDYCNITTESSGQRKRHRARKPFIKSTSFYLAQEQNITLNEQSASMQDIKQGALKKQHKELQNKKNVKWDLPQHYLRSNKATQQDFFA